jgi:hypothetical protein
VNPIQAHLEDREDRARLEGEADDRWLRERAGIDPEERRRAFNSWVKGLLLKSPIWPSDPARRERLLGQCAAEITVMCRQLRGRGWLLDGATLAAEVKACLDPITAYLRKGNVEDPFAYFRSSVRRYVGTHAEELQAHARRTGRDEGAQNMAAVMSGLGLDRLAKARPASMVEIVATPVAPKKKVGRRRDADKGDQTIPLL